MTKTAGPVTYPPHLARRQPGPSGEVSAPVAVSGAPVQKGFSAMNFRILAAPVWPRGRVFALLAATALGASLPTQGVQAQAPAPGAAPAPAPAAPKAKAPPPKAAPKAAAPGAPAPAAQQAPPAGAPAAAAQPADQQVQLIYAPWTKFCLKGQDANAKQVCFTGKDGRIESGQ